MINIELIKNILIVGIGAGIITTNVIQKIKESLKSKKYIGLISFGVSMVIGTLFAVCFSSVGFTYALWAGLISWIGADLIYKTFEDKIFKPFSKLNEVVEVPIENNIKGK